MRGLNRYGWFCYIVLIVYALTTGSIIPLLNFLGVCAVCGLLAWIVGDDLIPVPPDIPNTHGHKIVYYGVQAILWLIVAGLIAYLWHLSDI